MANEKTLSAGTILHSHKRDYKVLKVLGSGGFGITYLVEATIEVENIRTRAYFAVKEHFISTLCERDAVSLRVSFSDPVSETVERARRAFIKEANRLQSLGIRHHNIVNINEVFEANNTAYYVMEYLEGETLQQYLERRGTLSAAETLQLLRPIIHAIATLHSNNITHYDIKPSNIILVADTTDSIRPVLIDFGLSKHYDDSGAGTSSLLSQGYTPGYAPVEQYTGLTTYTPQADVYALAATIYCCLTGHKPAVATEFDVDALPQELAGKSPQSLISILQRAMAMTKQKRTPDAETLYRELYEGAETDMEQTYMAPDDSTVKIPNEKAQELVEEAVEETKASRGWIWITAIAMLVLGVGAYFLFSKKSSPEQASEQLAQEQPLISENQPRQEVEPADDETNVADDETEETAEATPVIEGTEKPANEAEEKPIAEGAEKPAEVAKATLPSEEEVLAKAKTQYDEVGDFWDDMAWVMKNGEYGFIDRTGKEVIKPQYMSPSNFFNGRALVLFMYGNFGYIDKKGNFTSMLANRNTGETSTETLPPSFYEEDDHIVTIYFSNESTEVTQTNKLALKEVAKIIKSQPSSKFIIRGWHDNYTGTEDQNNSIRLKRANNVRDILVNYGVHPNQLEIVIGSGHPCDLGLKYAALDRAVTIHFAQ